MLSFTAISDSRTITYATSVCTVSCEQGPLMEIADVKRKVIETVDRAKRQAGERRIRADEATKVYATFLDRTAVPICRQIANVLRAQGYVFNVFTPGGSVRLTPERG